MRARGYSRSSRVSWSLPLKEGPEVFPLPGDRRLEEREGALAIAECPRVMHPAPRPVGAGEELVEHFVEDDEFHEEPRHLRVVQRGVDTDLAGLVVVHPETNRLAAAPARSAAPSDARPHPALEEALVQPVAELLQMEEAPLRRERLVRGVTLLADARLLTLDELVQDPAGLRPPPPGVVRHRLDHWD